MGYGCAYEPPFSYKSDNIIGYSYYCSGNWFNTLKTTYGSEQRILNLIVPSILVDAYGDLYFCAMDMGDWFGGRSYYVGKVTTNNARSYKLIETATEIKKYYSKTYVWGKLSSNDEYFSKIMWHTLASACIAKETAYTSSLYVLWEVPAPRFWNTSDGDDKEGLVLCKINKSSLTVENVGCLDKKYCDQFKLSKLGEFTTKAYSRSIYNAIYDKDLDRVTLYWFHRHNSHTDKDTDSNTKTFLTRAYYKHRSHDDFNKSRGHGSLDGNVPIFNPETDALEPRIVKIGDYYHFLISSNFHSWWFKSTASSADIAWFDVNPHTCGIESSTAGQGTCYYHTDQQIFQHNGRNLGLFLSIVKTSHMGSMARTDSRSRWNNTFYIPWNTSYIALVLSSWYEGDGQNQANIDIPPENVINVFPISNATTGETTSTTTLYKNTHKFVVYFKNNENYIIYAYCYPGNKPQLYLGVARFKFQDNGHVRLFVKREFRDKKGNSFSNLTNCSRIISMDVKNGHLWVVFMSSDGKTIYYFHATADDIIKFAP